MCLQRQTAHRDVNGNFLPREEAGWPLSALRFPCLIGNRNAHSGRREHVDGGWLVVDGGGSQSRSNVGGASGWHDLGDDLRGKPSVLDSALVALCTTGSVSEHRWAAVCGHEQEWTGPCG